MRNGFVIRGLPILPGDLPSIWAATDTDEFVLGWVCGCPVIAWRSFDAGDIFEIPLFCPEHGAPATCLSNPGRK